MVTEAAIEVSTEVRDIYVLPKCRLELRKIDLVIPLQSEDSGKCQRSGGKLRLDDMETFVTLWW